MSTQNPTPDYGGLSKQEVAERLKSPTPDATATPRTDDGPSGNAPAVVAARRIACLASNGRGVSVAEALAYIEAEFTPFERELTAAKAEIARLNENLDRLTCVSVDAQARAERAEAEPRERTQWQCACGGTDCAGQAENQQLRAEVARLNELNHGAAMALKANSLSPSYSREAMAIETAAVLRADLKQMGTVAAERLEWHTQSRREADQLRARVAELEQDKARLIDSIDVEALDAIANELTSFADSARAHSLMSVAARQRAAIDAARAGKGAT